MPINVRHFASKTKRIGTATGSKRFIRMERKTSAKKNPTEKRSMTLARKPVIFAPKVLREKTIVYKDPNT